MVVIQWRMSDLARWCTNHSFQHAMYLKNEMQRALAYYAKGKKVDAVQEKAIAIIAKLEKWCRTAFVDREMIRICTGDPKMVYNSKKVKSLARQAWERYNSKESY